MATPRSSSSVGYLIAFPLMIIPFALYNMIAFLLDLKFGERLFAVSLMSGVVMDISLGDFLVIVGVLLLYLEFVKSTRLFAKQIMDHLLSLLLFIGMLVEFTSVPRAATSTFLILLALCFIDVIGGFTLRTAHRDVAIDASDGI